MNHLRTTGRKMNHLRTTGRKMNHKSEGYWRRRHYKEHVTTWKSVIITYYKATIIYYAPISQQ
jgi:hypothetical protein